MNLDLEQLKHTRAALIAEVNKIDALIKAVEDYQNQNPVPPAVEVQHHTPQNGQKIFHKVGWTQGTQRDILMLLSTGPSSQSDLQRTTKLSSHKLAVALGAAVRANLIDFVANKYSLTQNGRERVNWFEKHPLAKTYKPWMPEKVV